MGIRERFYVDIMSVHPEVTGSCNLVVVKYPDGRTTKFIVDCGMFQEKNYSEHNKSLPFNEDEIEFCLVTHNHIDHTGRLPFLIKKGFTGNIYLTKETKTLLPLALNDSYKVIKDLAKRNHVPELYSEANVANVTKHLKPCIFDKTEYVNSNIKVTFFSNGHLPGAAIILVQISYPGSEDINLLFTGDYNNKNMFFDVVKLPQWVLELPIIIIQESTYGTTDSTSKIECFEENVARCISNRGTVVSPVFSLGRFQEVLYTLKKMQHKGVISTQTPIYADGKLGIQYTNLYMHGDIGIREDMTDFLPENLTFVSKDTRDSVVSFKDSKIIVTTSGMGTYGPAQIYIPEYLRRPNSLIQFTGYTAEGTLGSCLKNSEKGEPVTVGGILLKKMADVEYTTEFSAHAKADEMIAFLKDFSNIKLILINHGEENVKREFSKRILKEVDPKAVGILGREYFYRVGPYGFIRSLSTKFN